MNTSSDWTLNRKIFHTNVGALVAFLTLFGHCAALLVFLGSWTTVKIVVAEFPFYVLLAMVPWLNRQGHDNLARWSLVFSAMASQFIAVFVSFGSLLNVHLYFILFAILPIAIFPIKQWRAIVVLFVLNATLYQVKHEGRNRVSAHDSA